ncbi:nuclear transport factor 2 family protein [Gilvimarinus sp. DA14]|uniref:nuclear transport factor 2 family protein n=1 Tax=Gilvimarinus sp. DA14 TaxID=2956798 RepID=UPI0020B7367D|nr:nuclear transport factor 2 family protein [Gilvimarinus sp. DA14]UTF58852.1 nuclear transport factor 2 family protein [Gilvimarinus sp. DA14]
MKHWCTAVVLWLVSALAMAQHSIQVQDQVAAYNLHDADKYASYFHDDIEVYNYPDTPVTSGKGALIATTSRTFAQHEPTSEILKVIELNDKVITLERASYKVKGTRQQMDVVKIYQFQGGLIRRMTFMN